MTKIISQIAWMALFVCLVIVGDKHACAEIAWQTQLKTAHAQAMQEGKLLLLHFYTDNCVFCDKLEAGAFRTPEVMAAIQKNYVPVKIHAGKNPAIASTFKVSRFPTDVIVTTQGQALAHSVSPQDPVRYVAMLTQHATPGNADGSMIASNAPADGPGLGAAPIQMNPAVAENSMMQNTGFGMPKQASGTPATAVSRRSGLAIEPLPSVQPTLQPKQNPLLELAMDGYCAVTVIEKDQWVEGNPEFGVVHLGRLYLFCDKASMERFLEDPVTYTPVLNGIDVVRFFEERKIVQGNRAWGLKDPDHNRMFFFADEAALNHFYNQHTRYTDAAMAVMEKAIKDANPGN